MFDITHYKFRRFMANDICKTMNEDYLASNIYICPTTSCNYSKYLFKYNMYIFLHKKIAYGYLNMKCSSKGCYL